MKVLITTSTLPVSDKDPVPSFVKDQALNFKNQYPSMEITILAPHNSYSRTSNAKIENKIYREVRFHYFWPYRFELLSGRGIMPALAKNKMLYFQIPFLIFFQFTALLRLAIKEKPDYIYAHWFTPQAITARAVSVFTRIPYVLTTHASDAAVWKKIPFIGGLIVKSNTKHAAAITAVSQRTLEKLKMFFNEEGWNAIKSKTAIIPMGVNLSNTISQNNRKAPAENILFIGRLVEKKGVSYLLQAFAGFHDKIPDARLVVAGEGPLLDDLKLQAEKLKIDSKVTFTGYVVGKNKLEVIKNADIYVVPSIVASSGDAEGLPVSLMEGLANGKICIATNESGADNIIKNGYDGFLVPEKNVELLSQAIEKALNLTASQRESMKQRAYKLARQFSWPEIAQKHYEFLFGVNLKS